MTTIRSFGMHPSVQPFVMQRPKPSTPRFGGFTTTFDFRDIGGFGIPISSMPQCQLVYGSCILARLLAAKDRSWNEVREHASRDVLGWSFWFFATPIVQRLFLKVFAPEAVKKALLVERPEPTGTGIWAGLKKLNWRYNPYSRWRLPSGSQIEARKRQAVETFFKALAETSEEQGLRTLSPAEWAALFKQRSGKLLPWLSNLPDFAMKETDQKALQSVFSKFEELKKWRGTASFVGLATCFLLLGVLINLFNIYITQKNVAEGKVGLRR